MSQKFSASVQHRGDVSYVKLGGVIDEDNELSDLVDKIPSGTAVIDLGEIERINSCGVRDWVNWLSKLESNGTRSVLVECSPAIVAQINLVNNFTGSGVVKSFYVPYFCPECDEEKVLLVEASDMGPPPHEPPTLGRPGSRRGGPPRPSTQRTSTQRAQSRKKPSPSWSGRKKRRSKPPSRPPLGKAPSAPQLAAMSMRMPAGGPMIAPNRSNA